MKNYQIHIDLAFRIVTDFQENSKRELINLQQKIMTGLDSKGDKVNNTKIVMEVSQLAKDLTEVDYLRLLIVYFASFELSSKDKSTMLKSLSEEKHRTAVQNLEYIDERLVSTDKSKFKRRFKEQSKDVFIEYQRQRAQSEFEILRNDPKICKILKLMHTN